jgi:hypothetical protein
LQFDLLCAPRDVVLHLHDLQGSTSSEKAALQSKLCAHLVLRLLHGLGEPLPILLRLIGLLYNSIPFIAFTHPQSLVVLCESLVHVIKFVRTTWRTFCNSRARFSILIFV